MKKEYDFSGAKRGAVLKVPAGKTRITIRIDNDVLDWFREKVRELGGGNYQSLINETLRQYISSTNEAPEDKPRGVAQDAGNLILEKMLRRVLREELPSAEGERKVS